MYKVHYPTVGALTVEFLPDPTVFFAEKTRRRTDKCQACIVFASRKTGTRLQMDELLYEHTTEAVDRVLVLILSICR